MEIGYERNSMLEWFDRHDHVTVIHLFFIYKLESATLLTALKSSGNYELVHKEKCYNNRWFVFNKKFRKTYFLWFFHFNFFCSIQNLISKFKKLSNLCTIPFSWLQESLINFLLRTFKILSKLSNLHYNKTL